MLLHAPDRSAPAGPAADALAGEATGGKHRPTRAESAISVDFEDYANTPDDDGAGALNAEGELQDLLARQAIGKVGLQQN